jgi:hypothetical protein
MGTAIAPSIMPTGPQTISSVGDFMTAAGTKEGLKQIGTETLKNLAKPETLIRGGHQVLFQI